MEKKVPKILILPSIAFIILYEYLYRIYDLNAHVSMALIFFIIFFFVHLSFFSHNKLKKDEGFFLLYSLVVFFVVFLIDGVNSFNWLYSTQRAFVSFYSLFVYYLFISRVFFRFDRFEYSYLVLCFSVLVFLMVAMDIAIVDQWTGSRFSGGVNPNYVAYYSLMMILLSLLALKFKPNRFFLLLVVFSSVAIIVLSGSRSALLVLAFTCVFYISKKVNRHLYSWSVLASFSAFSLMSFYLINSFLDMSLVERGLTLISRANTWSFLLDGNDWFFGHLGWRYSSVYLDNYGSYFHLATASSSHNFFVRALSEVGILGLLAVISLPAYLVWRAGKKSYQEMPFIYNFASAALPAFFIGQFFEDKYLSAVFSFNELFAVVVMAILLKENYSKGDKGISHKDVRAFF